VVLIPDRADTPLFGNLERQQPAKESPMRHAIIVALAALVTGCAATATHLAPVYDHRTNTTSYKPADGDFVGTSQAVAKPVPHWYRFGHP
jgi:hypothetical protein